MKVALAASAALCALAGGCAAFAPPEPCTTPWFDYEARQAFRPVRRDLRSAIDQLEAAQRAMQRPDPGVGAAVRLAFAANAGLSLIEAIDRDALPRLNAAAQRCDDPGFVRRAVFDFLDEEGVDDLLTSDEGAFAGLSVALEGLFAEP